MNRSSTAVLAFFFIFLLFASVALWVALRMPALEPAQFARAFTTMVCLLLLVGAAAIFLPLSILRRERDAVNDLTRRIGAGDEERARLLARADDRQAKGDRDERLAALGRFASGLAHEIRNPITNVIGYAALLRERCTDENLRGDLKIIEEEARRCESVTDSILAFSRTPRIANETVDIASVFAPPSGEIKIVENAARIEGDKTLLRQVAENLFRNAADAGAKKIDVRVKRAGTHVVIRITDDGKGIPVHLLERIFEPFATARKGGLGLGLALARGVIAAHGGAIKARNRPEGGAEFEITLPVRRPSTPPAAGS